MARRVVWLQLMFSLFASSLLLCFTAFCHLRNGGVGRHSRGCRPPNVNGVTKPGKGDDFEGPRQPAEKHVVRTRFNMETGRLVEIEQTGAGEKCLAEPIR